MDYAAWGEAKTTYEINAYALGARLVNPRARTVGYTLRGINQWSEHDKARKVMAEAGAEGVGVATTRSVVSAIIVIFIMNCFLSLILYK